MAGWHHQCKAREVGQILGDGEGQGGLACCNPWGHKELDMTEFKFVFWSFSLSSCLGPHIMQMLFSLVLPQKSLKKSSLFKILFLFLLL